MKYKEGEWRILKLILNAMTHLSPTFCDLDWSLFNLWFWYTRHSPAGTT
jgi:hypothetical protein